MQKKFFLIILLTVLFWVALKARAEPLEEKVIRYTLKNGMKFLLVKRSEAPVFAGYIRVKVGGADEKEGQSGIAHMLEHMAFKGTPRIGTKNFAQEKKILDQIETVGVRLAELTRQGLEKSEEATRLKAQLKQLQQLEDRYIVKEEFSRAFTKNGASEFNATTSKDLTSYFVELPSSKLELWAYLESERLKNSVFREFYQERDVVMEERRTRVDNSPFGKNYETLLAASFAASPYRTPTIGYEKEIATLTATELQKFYKKYYVPKNMLGAVVGDIDVDQTKKILEQYFGSIPSGPLPPAVEFHEPKQETLKQANVRFDARPQIMIGFHKPTLPQRDDFIFDLVDQILCEGRTSRLHENLIEKQKIAQTVDCDSGTPGSRFDNLFFIYASALGKHTPAELQRAIEGELEKMKSQPVGEDELKRARNQILADRFFRIDSNLGLAETLTYFEAIAGDWHYLLKHEEVIKTVTPKEIQAVAKKYFVNNNQTISILDASEK
jgi:predicted Zn-dependent peptidase